MPDGAAGLRKLGDAAGAEADGGRDSSSWRGEKLVIDASSQSAWRRWNDFGRVRDS